MMYFNCNLFSTKRRLVKVIYAVKSREG
jgi:hypothetical protein